MNESGVKSKLGKAEITDILKLLPHRYPFLMVDRIVDMDGDRSATGIKNVTANEPHFQGHFPGNPVMPGVLLIEALSPRGGLVDDFVFDSSPSVIHVRNAPSPAATASLAIGDHIASMAVDQFGLA